MVAHRHALREALVGLSPKEINPLSNILGMVERSAVLVESMANETDLSSRASNTDLSTYVSFNSALT